VPAARTVVERIRNTEYSTASARRVLPLKQYIAMALRDTLMVDEALSEMIAEGYNAAQLRDARAWRALYLRVEPWPASFAKLWLNDSLMMRSASTTREPVISNYPNPFTASTVIEYRLPESAHVTLDIYTASGRHVRRCVDADEAAGTHRVELRSADMSSTGAAVYFYILRANNTVVSGKMINRSR
jgi:hypothetical protein